MAAEREYRLPLSAVATITDPSLQFHLYCINFSHYNERARWLLRLAGISNTQHIVLPPLHVPGITRVYNSFTPDQRAGDARGRKTETPALAVYDAAGAPVCLLQDGALIGRYCVLRAQAVPPRTPCPPLYGPLPLTLHKDGLVTGEGPVYAEIEALEARLSKRLGIEARRVVYFYILPQFNIMVPLLRNNAPTRFQASLAPLLALVLRLLLPKGLNINKKTAAIGQDGVRAELDFVDGILAGALVPSAGNGSSISPHGSSTTGSGDIGSSTGVNGSSMDGNGSNAGAASSAGAGASGSSNSGSSNGGSKSAAGTARRHLVGDQLSAADVTVATLAAPLLWVLQDEGYGGWMPRQQLLSSEARAFVQELRRRPSGVMILELFEKYALPYVKQGASA